MTCLEFGDGFDVTSDKGSVERYLTVVGTVGWATNTNVNTYARYSWKRTAAPYEKLHIEKVYDGTYRTGRTDRECLASEVISRDTVTNVIAGEYNWKQVSTGSVVEYPQIFLSYASQSKATDLPRMTNFLLSFSQRSDRPTQLLDVPPEADESGLLFEDLTFLLVASIDGPITHSEDISSKSGVYFVRIRQGNNSRNGDDGYFLWVIVAVLCGGGLVIGAFVIVIVIATIRYMWGKRHPYESLN